MSNNYRTVHVDAIGVFVTIDDKRYRPLTGTVYSIGDRAKIRRLDGIPETAEVGPERWGIPKS